MKFRVELTKPSPIRLTRNDILEGLMKRITHWINGKPFSGVAQRQGKVFNPATGLQGGEVDFASADDVDVAVAAAKAAFPGWRATSLAKRTTVLFALRELKRFR